MTIFQRITQPFQKLISKLNTDDETEADIDEPADPYVVDLVTRLESLRSRAATKKEETLCLSDRSSFLGRRH